MWCQIHHSNPQCPDAYSLPSSKTQTAVWSAGHPQKVSGVTSGFLSKDTKVVFNCTGNAARTLKGVEDPKCYPTRGQILLAKAAHINQNVMRHGKDYETYIIPRPHSKGNVILGGYMQKGVG